MPPTTKLPLTRKQKAVFDFIDAYLAANGYSPTLEEIGAHFGMASLNAVHKHITTLEQKGFIRRMTNRARSIQLVPSLVETERAARIPMLGRIAAGRPIEAVENREEIEVPEALLTRGSNFVLQVEGDSMIDEQIKDGDLIIVEQRSTARDGETVVALIDGDRATLKKFYAEGDQIRLQPANPFLKPIYVDPTRLQIQGVVVGLMRRY